MLGTLQSGDWIIFRKTKHSEHPGPRAANINPARFGEAYTYTVDKFWVVRDVLTDGTLVVATRRGKVHHIAGDDPRVKRANLLQRILYRSRFETVIANEAAARSLSDESGAA
jgi:hypothetical protein